MRSLFMLSEAPSSTLWRMIWKSLSLRRTLIFSWAWTDCSNPRNGFRSLTCTTCSTSTSELRDSSSSKKQDLRDHLRCKLQTRLSFHLSSKWKELLIKRIDLEIHRKLVSLLLLSKDTKTLGRIPRICMELLWQPISRASQKEDQLVVRISSMKLSMIGMLVGLPLSDPI